ncbi:MAG: PEGA domain-containing protein [Deltaproteobacteria bacterium]|nr:PEGA domain-containing protein [Deltaproteobacteria bacterium]
MQAKLRLICFFLIGATAPLAGAQDRLTLFFRSRPATLETQKKLISALEQKLNQTDGVLVSIPEKPVDLEVVGQAARRSAELISETREAYKKFDHATAIKRLAEAREVLVSGCGGASLSLFRSHYFLEGLIHFMDGKRDMARQAFSRLAAIDPAWQPDPKELAPKIVSLYQQARAELLKQPKSLVTIDGFPRAASVYLDGQKIGTLPLVQEGIPPGSHCLTVSAPDHNLWIRKVTLPVNSKLRLRIALFPDRAGFLLEGKPLEESGADPGETARAFGTDYLILGDVFEDKVVAVLINSSSGKVSKLIICPVVSDPTSSVRPSDCIYQGVIAARRISLEDKLAQLPVIDPPPVIGDLGKKDAKKTEPVSLVATAWYNTWWFWSLVGSVAVGAGVGLGYHLLSGSEDSSYQIIITRPR